MDFFILFEYMFWTCFGCVTCIKNEIYTCSSHYIKMIKTHFRKKGRSGNHIFQLEADSTFSLIFSRIFKISPGMQGLLE